MTILKVKMSLVRINRHLLKNLVNSHRVYGTSILNEEEYTEKPQYPPILDLSHECVKERKNLSDCDTIKAVKTVEEKQIKLNMPRYYGFKSYMMLEDQVPYNQLTLTQHITRTHLIEQNHLPEYYSKIDVHNLMDLRHNVEENLLLEYDGYRKIYEINGEEIDQAELENTLSSSVCRQLNRLLLNSLSNHCLHLKDVQVDFDPRVECSWVAGGMNPPEELKKARKGLEFLKNKENEPVDRVVQYIGKPSVTLRSQVPLAAIIPYSEAENTALEVPYFQYDPRVVGIFIDRRTMANTPGFWPGDQHQFGILSYHQRGHFITRPNYNDVQELKEALHRQGILASFGWLSAQANHLGFTTYNDITYPLVTQTAITNGQTWSFYVYQLNTLLMHSKNAKENPKRNVCWATPELKLFEEIKDGKVIGFNDEVLKLILQFYANIPEERVGVELRPYLSAQEKLISDYGDDDKREWLEREYKFIVSNRPRHKLDYEVYDWEKIYKVDHQTRPMEAKRRPFELFINPWYRTLNDRQAKYIPRKLRPDLPRHKGRYAKEYFP